MRKVNVCFVRVNMHTPIRTELLRYKALEAAESNQLASAGQIMAMKPTVPPVASTGTNPPVPPLKLHAIEPATESRFRGSPRSFVSHLR
jgi:hypothetical protein